jgi:hypothetical protein
MLDSFIFTDTSKFHYNGAAQNRCGFGGIQDILDLIIPPARITNTLSDQLTSLWHKQEQYQTR